IPEERLFKIARRKLLALGIQTWFSEDQKQLKGEIVINPPMELLDPTDGKPIKKARFMVVGHDRIRFFMPESLVGLPPQPFIDFNSLEELVNDMRARLGGPAPVEEPEVPQAKQPPPAAGPQKGISLETLTTALGKDAQMGPGSTIAKQMSIDGKTVRFLTRFEQGDTFVARVDTEDGVAWKGHFDMETFPGAEAFVAEALGTEVPVEQIAPEPMQAETAFTGMGIPGYQMPVVGEEWVMNILVEKEDEEETRYVSVNVDGQPYGAPRVLPTEAFLKTFVCVGKGVYRLLARVEEVTPDKVTYVRLDYDRQPAGNPITTDLVPFLASFSPEAASY
ncbi:hypothetical protein ACFL2F_04285, partial [Myxococcota bacterium]